MAQSGTIFRTIYSLASAMAILLSSLDFFLIKEFHQEGVFVMLTFVLFLFNILRLNIKAIPDYKWLNIIINLGIICYTCFAWALLMVFLFGYGFTGRSIQWIWILAFVVDASLFVFSLSGLIKRINN